MLIWAFPPPCLPSWEVSSLDIVSSFNCLSEGILLTSTVFVSLVPIALVYADEWLQADLHLQHQAALGTAGYLFTYYNTRLNEERKAQIERVNEQVLDFPQLVLL